MRISRSTFVIAASFLVGAGSALGQEAPAPMVVELVAPVRTGGMPLMQALEGRRSVREFDERELTREQLSSLLWAADGVNRPASGGRTAPSAHAKYPVDIYVVLAGGVYRYDAARHVLESVAAGDHRAQAGAAPHEVKAPLNLVYVADLSRVQGTPGSPSREEWLSWVAIEAGCLSQNVSLYCASEGLGTVVRVSVPHEKFRSAARLSDDQVILAGQSVGYPAGK